MRDTSRPLAGSNVEITGQPMFVGYMQAGACQDVCAHLRCADMSTFTVEHVELSARNFAAQEYDSALCTGPSGNIGATP